MTMLKDENAHAGVEQQMQLYHGDCLVEMGNIPDHSVDMILCDLPYGTTACKWDVIIPFEPLWEHYWRIIKPNGAIVLFSSQPFTTKLIFSQMECFKYCWYWRKSRPSGFVNAKLKPLKDIEDICVFSTGTTANKSNNNMKYLPQDLKKIDKSWKRPSRYEGEKGVNPTRNSHKLDRIIEFTNYPRQILDFANPNNDNKHPTQKPISLLEYLIKTYTNENEIILDNCMGSGSTGVACINTNRNFIGIEKDDKYFEIAKSRIESLC